jgi:hypothetical protein
MLLGRVLPQDQDGTCSGLNKRKALTSLIDNSSIGTVKNKSQGKSFGLDWTAFLVEACWLFRYSPS